MAPGIAQGVRRLTTRLWALSFLLLLTWPSSAIPAPLERPLPNVESVRQLLQDVAVRIDIIGEETRGICTGWIGWSEHTRSAAYTAAHCYREGARYRLTLGTGETVFATSLTRWDGLDLMALWIPRGDLRALRSWKPMPGGAFHVFYVLSERGAPPRFVDVPIPRVYWEIRFENHPSAVALPLYSVPGTSGAPVVDAADGLLVGMIVGFVTERPGVAAVVPAQSIYEALSSASR
ncbi:MAG: trypsin-like peptidase domain-containing protein [bacterium]